MNHRCIPYGQPRGEVRVMPADERLGRTHVHKVVAEERLPRGRILRSLLVAEERLPRGRIHLVDHFIILPRGGIHLDHYFVN